MLPRVPAALATLGVLALAAGGCDQVMDAINAGSTEAKQNELNRAGRGAEAEPAPSPAAAEAARREAAMRQAARERQAVSPAAARRRAASPPPGAGGVPLDPATAGGKLLVEIERRLACHTADCKKAALDQISLRRAELLPGIPDVLKGQRDAVRHEAVALAGLFEVRDAVPALGQLAMVATGLLRDEILWALGQIGDPRAVTWLDHVSRAESRPEGLRALCRALGRMGDERALPALQRAVEKGDRDSRLECLRAIKRIGGKEALALVKALQKDADPAVAGEAKAAYQELRRKKR